MCSVFPGSALPVAFSRHLPVLRGSKKNDRTQRNHHQAYDRNLTPRAKFLPITLEEFVPA